MYFALFTARRYLLGRKRLGATGWITLISAIAIAIVTAALVTVLSVYNGYVAMLLGGEKASLPELLIKPSSSSLLDMRRVDSLLRLRELTSAHSAVLSAQGVLQSSGAQFYTEVYGVDSNYTHVLAMDSAMAEGAFLERDYIPSQTSGQELSPITLGIALAVEGAVKESDSLGMQLLFPRREGFVNPLVAASNFVIADVYSVGVLPPYNEQINRRVYIPLEDLQGYLSYEPHQVSAVALSLRAGLEVDAVQEELSQLLGPDYKILSREEQQPELTFLIKAERVMVYLIMLFILILAAFNLASSLVMLILEKGKDLKTFRIMGASPSQIALIFSFTGFLTSGLGVAIGLIFGYLLCFVQGQYPFIYSGEGLSRMPFPIDLRWTDFASILLITTIITALSALLPLRILRTHRA